MKKIIQTIFYCLLVYTLSAQGSLVIPFGTELIISNNTNLVLQNTDIENEGVLDALNSGTTLVFSGDTDNYINSFDDIEFYNLKINKTSDGTLVLNTDILVENDIDMTAGILDLNGYLITLDGGQIVNETQSNHIKGTGGRIEYITTLNNPNSVNPGNLGIEITSSANLGQTTIRRSHQVQTGESGGESIERYFDINPTNNTGLNATLRMYYYDHELNSIPENELGFYRSEDNGTSWDWIGFDILNAAENYIQESGIDAFSRWTIGSETTNPLPVELGVFTGEAKESFNLLEWTTLSEDNVSHFEIQKLKDTHWQTIDRVEAIGFSIDEHVYQYKDRTFKSEDYYRLRVIDFDGAENFSSIININRLIDSAELFNVYPNPFADKLMIDAEGLDAIILYDALGRELFSQTSDFENINVSNLTEGVYILEAQFGQQLISKRITKQ